jgi:prefoldin subunit 5
MAKGKIFKEDFMVTKEMARRVVKVLDEVEECKNALELLKSENKQEDPLIHVFKDEDGEGFCISVSRVDAVDVIKKTLERLKEEYSGLNNAILEEVNNG